MSRILRPANILAKHSGCYISLAHSGLNQRWRECMGLDLAAIVCLQMRVPACQKFQILRAFISRLMYSACRRARATMVRVGLAAPAVVKIGRASCRERV